jgi:hypothetical protein
MDTKTCTKCGNIKAYSEFYKDARRKDGLASWCKEFVCEYKKAYYATDKGKAVVNEYVEKNKEKRAIYNREYSTNISFCVQIATGFYITDNTVPSCLKRQKV